MQYRHCSKHSNGRRGVSDGDVVMWLLDLSPKLTKSFLSLLIIWGSCKHVIRTIRLSVNLHGAKWWSSCHFGALCNFGVERDPYHASLTNSGSPQFIDLGHIFFGNGFKISEASNLPFSVSMNNPTHTAGFFRFSSPYYALHGIRIESVIICSKANSVVKSLCNSHVVIDSHDVRRKLQCQRIAPLHHRSFLKHYSKLIHS